MVILEKFEVKEKKRSPVKTKDNVNKLSLFDKIPQKERKIYSMDFSVNKPLEKFEYIKHEKVIQKDLSKDKISDNLPMEIPREDLIVENKLPMVLPKEDLELLDDFVSDSINSHDLEEYAKIKKNIDEFTTKKLESDEYKFFTEDEFKSDLKSISHLCFSNKTKSNMPIINNSKEILNNNVNFNKKKLEVKENLDQLLEELNQKALNLNKKETFLEEFSFLDNKPKIKKISLDKYNVKHLYSKIDEISKKSKKLNEFDKSNKSQKHQNKVEGVFEEIKIPDIFVIKDDSENLNTVIENDFSSFERNIPLSKNFNLFEHKNNFLELSEDVKNHIFNNSNNSKFTPKLDVNLVYEKAVEDDNHLKKVISNKNKSLDSVNKENRTLDNIVKLSKPSTRVISKKKIFKKKNKQSNLDYILPIKDSSKNLILNKGKNKLSHNLIYSVPIKDLDFSQEQIFEKYSLDDFTFVNIYFEKEKGLIYDLVQPELNNNQQKLFFQIKNMFYNNIDKDYFYFKGDSHKIKEYISKIYDLTINRLSFKISSLERKLFLKFIYSDFSGLGILSSLLDDKKIIEISCSGENQNISVYHIEYGLLNTNIKFENISKLNEFVINLTKNMGLYISSTNPIIDGYLPNGYKVEGIYSIGDSLSKGSSFVIKKYLKKSITPVGLVKIGIGINEIYSYIWQAISEKYKVIITGDDDNFLIFNSIALFLPQKKIISIQDYDRIILPQKNWVKRKVSENEGITKSLLINQTNSERPDYILLDTFNKDLFNVEWYNIDLLCVDKKILNEFVEHILSINQKAIIIDLKRTRFNSRELLEFNNIVEISKDKKEIFEFIQKDKEYHVSFLNTDLNVIDIKNKQKVIRWLLDSNIYDFKDFNNIINEYYINKDKLFEKLGVEN